MEFRVPGQTGQKTGWFYDHRENRQLLQRLAPGKRVLDVFSYVGGWGIQAAAAGAEYVLCVDSSEKALAYVGKNAALNGVSDKVDVMAGKAFEVLAELVRNKEKYDIAKDGYENVIAHSLSKEKIEKAHLQILKILRIEKKYRSASRKIKGMLTDDKFKNIAGNLELELVQL